MSSHGRFHQTFPSLPWRGAQFIVYTDHKALISLLSKADPTRRIARWLQCLGEYNFTAVYKRGPDNLDADAMSRLFSARVPRNLEKQPPAGVVHMQGGTLIWNHDTISVSDLLRQQLHTECQFEKDISTNRPVVTKNGLIVCSLCTPNPSSPAVHYSLASGITHHASATPSLFSKSVTNLDISPVLSSSDFQPLFILPVRDNVPIIAWNEVAIDLPDAYRFIRQQFIDEENGKRYLITDVFYDDSTDHVVGHRELVLEDGTSAPDPDDNGEPFDIVYLRQRVHQSQLPPTPTLSLESIKAEAFALAVEAELQYLLQHNHIQEDQIELVPDEQGHFYYYYRSHDPHSQLEQLSLVVPRNDKVLQSALIHQCHEAVGHHKRDKTLQVLSRYVWWYGITIDVRDFVRACPDCIRRGAPTDRAISTYPVLHHNLVIKPWQRVSLDLQGPFPKSHSGNEYLIIAVDHFTKFAIGLAIEDKDARTIADFIVTEILFRYSAPDIILTDQGKEFCNQLNAWLCDSLHIHHARTASYNPASNAQVERFNQTVANCLSKRCSDESHKDWDRHVSACIAASNICINRTTGYTPYYLLYGHECRLPLDQLLPKPTSSGARSLDYSAYSEELSQRLHSAHSVTLTQQVAAQSLYNRPKVIERLPNTFRTRAYKSFNIGDLVMLWVPHNKAGTAKKLIKMWEGPYRVIRVINSVSYKIQPPVRTNIHNVLLKSQTRHRTRIVHVNRLKTYYGVDPYLPAQL